MNKRNRKNLVLTAQTIAVLGDSHLRVVAAGAGGTRSVVDTCHATTANRSDCKDCSAVTCNGL